jgi:hypothetical protein
MQHPIGRPERAVVVRSDDEAEDDGAAACY